MYVIVVSLRPSLKSHVQRVVDVSIVVVHLDFTCPRSPDGKITTIGKLFNKATFLHFCSLDHRLIERLPLIVINLIQRQTDEDFLSLCVFLCYHVIINAIPRDATNDGVSSRLNRSILPLPINLHVYAITRLLGS